jgi:hypothetical protein
MATIENFEMSEMDIENPSDLNDQNQNVIDNESEMLNIGEFVFNHITAETDGSFLQLIRRKVAIHSKWLIKVCTIIDVAMYITFLFLSLFLLVQKNTVIAFSLSWQTYCSLIATFIEGIICIWILKLIIEAGYEHKIYTTYILYRLISIILIMLSILTISIQHLTNPPKDLTGTKKNILIYYLIVTTGCNLWLMAYIVVSSVIYSFHMSVVKEFYKIVAIIVEAHNQYKKNKNDLEVAQGIPEVWVGVPFFDRSQIPMEGKEESLEFSMKDAKFEVQIELQHEEPKENRENISMIKVFQCDSESSESDSYRIDLQSTLKRKKQSWKIVRGRKLTTDDEDYFGLKKRESEKAKKWESSNKILKVEDEAIKEEDEEMFGLDFLGVYQKEMRPNHTTEKYTNFTTDGDLVASPISKGSFKKLSVKKVIRNESFKIKPSFKNRGALILAKESEKSRWKS